MSSKRILIADSGSTKTQWVLVEYGKKDLRLDSAGINPNYQRDTEIYDTLDSLQEFRDANFCKSIEQIFFYGAGCSGEENCETVEIALRKKFPIATIEVESDMLGAARALCKNNKGIACIIGTGSNSCLYNGEIIETSVPSYGYLFGDHGSGAVLGRQLIEAYCNDLLPQDLKKALELETSITRESILLHVYKLPFPNRYLASFVPFIHRHIENEFLHQMVVMSFADFLHFQIAKYPDAKSMQLNFTGSVAYQFSSLLAQVIESTNFKMGLCVQHPMEELIRYHSSNQ